MQFNIEKKNLFGKKIEKNDLETAIEKNMKSKSKWINRQSLLFSGSMIAIIRLIVGS